MTNTLLDDEDYNGDDEDYNGDDDDDVNGGDDDDYVQIGWKVLRTNLHSTLIHLKNGISWIEKFTNYQEFFANRLADSANSLYFFLLSNIWWKTGL